jgi:hypothetical protein
MYIPMISVLNYWMVDIPDHTDPPNPGLKIDVEVHLDTDFACHSGGC